MAMHQASKGRRFLLALLMSVSAVLANEGLPKSSQTVGTANKQCLPAPRIQKPRLLAERDENYERCANICQKRIDEALGNCPGAREVQEPEDTSPPVPKCKRNAVEEFERCLQTCPPPPTSLG